MRFYEAAILLSAESSLAITNSCTLDWTPAMGAVAKIIGNLSRMIDILQTVMSIVSCERIIPIFTTVLHDGTCTYSVQAFTWAFVSFLVIATMGIVMILFRSAYLPIGDDGKRVEALSTDPVEQVSLHFDPTQDDKLEELSYLSACEEINSDDPTGLDLDEFLDCQSWTEDNDAR
jgi:hypothetical protein